MNKLDVGEMQITQHVTDVGLLLHFQSNTPMKILTDALTLAIEQAVDNGMTDAEINDQLLLCAGEDAIRNFMISSSISDSIK